MSSNCTLADHPTVFYVKENMLVIGKSVKTALNTSSVLCIRGQL